MNRFLTALALLISPMAQAQTLAERGTPLDHLAGRWVMTGVIAGQEITHDLEAEWALGGHYLYFHELARERDETGAPAYEARVYFGWDEQGERLVCLWLDVTGGGGLVPEGFGYGVPEGDRIPFVWGQGTGSGIHNTFTYRPESDSWAWQIDNVRDGEASPFARVALTRNVSASASIADSEEARQHILEAIARLSDATAPGGGGADAYAAVLSDDFKRWSSASDEVEGRQAVVDGVRDWLNDGWRVSSRESRMLDSTILGDRAYTHRIVTESYSGTDGASAGPSTFALEETWRNVDGTWLLQRSMVYPIAD